MFKRKKIAASFCMIDIGKLKLKRNLYVIIIAIEAFFPNVS